uniref:Uncharacterized protein n=1 Tax=Glossina austeni TaxID=7395 RepID=A0A1A9UHW8_GLOAU
MSYTELESGYQDLRQQSSQQAAANSSQQTHHVLLAGGSDRQQPCPGFFVGHDGNMVTSRSCQSAQYPAVKYTLVYEVTILQFAVDKEIS